MANKSSSTNVVSLVLTIVFGIVAFVIAYAAFSGGTLELRSKAATIENVLQSWEFDGATTEGWQGINVAYPLKVENGMLSGAVGRSDLTFVNLSVNKLFPAGLRQFKITMRATPGTSSGRAGIPSLSPVPTKAIVPVATPTPAPFSMQVHLYRKVSVERKNKKTGETRTVLEEREIGDSSMQIEGIADGQMKSYAVKFPDAVSLKDLQVDVIRLQFPNIVSSRAVTLDIDWIRVVMIVPVRPTPTPRKIIPSPSAGTVVEGTITRDNLEGGSPYLLVTKNKTTYRIIVETAADEFTDKSGQRPEQKIIDLSAYVGKSVRVTGRVVESADNKSAFRPGIPTVNQRTIYIRSVEII